MTIEISDFSTPHAPHVEILLFQAETKNYIPKYLEFEKTSSQ